MTFDFFVVAAYFSPFANDQLLLCLLSSIAKNER